jgi:hypothetical protein
MTFKDQEWNARFARMGDEAEKVFEESCDRGYVRYGLNRPPLAVHLLPRRIRYTPDYLTSEALVEVQGFGRDQQVKLKTDKYDALRWWNLTMQTRLALWDSHNQRFTTVTLNDVAEQIDEGNVELRKFPEGKAYYSFDAELFFNGKT